MLRLFVNILTADGMYSLLNRDNLSQPIQMQLSQIQNIFSKSFSQRLKSRWNFENLKKKMTRIAHVFLKLRTPKKVITLMS